MTTEELELLNGKLREFGPEQIVKWAIELAKKPIVTTNFRPYEACILHAVSQVRPDIPVVWCDTGYNTSKTYKHAEKLIMDLGLQVDLYVPRQTRAHRDAVLGLPEVDDPKHSIFTEEVKLEPFKRAMAEHNPDLWFTNLRKGQTAFRDGIDIVSIGMNGILKVSPFYYFSNEQLDGYLEKNNLPNEHEYYDPTKVLGNRECGLHK